MLTNKKIIKSETESHPYYPHSCCHQIGLDVHDPGTRGALKENMVITIEPGIYVPDDANCDKKWWGIGVRIEDDYVINTMCPNDNGYGDYVSMQIDENGKIIRKWEELPQETVAQFITKLK